MNVHDPPSSSREHGLGGERSGRTRAGRGRCRSSERQCSQKRDHLACLSRPSRRRRWRNTMLRVLASLGEERQHRAGSAASGWERSVLERRVLARVHDRVEIEVEVGAVDQPRAAASRRSARRGTRAGARAPELVGVAGQARSLRERGAALRTTPRRGSVREISTCEARPDARRSFSASSDSSEMTLPGSRSCPGTRPAFTIAGRSSVDEIGRGSNSSPACSASTARGQSSKSITPRPGAARGAVRRATLRGGATAARILPRRSPPRSAVRFEWHALPREHQRDLRRSSRPPSCNVHDLVVRAGPSAGARVGPGARRDEEARRRPARKSRTSEFERLDRVAKRVCATSAAGCALEQVRAQRLVAAALGVGVGGLGEERTARTRSGRSR